MYWGHLIVSWINICYQMSQKEKKRNRGGRRMMESLLWTKVTNTWGEKNRTSPASTTILVTIILQTCKSVFSPQAVCFWSSSLGPASPRCLPRTQSFQGLLWAIHFEQTSGSRNPCLVQSVCKRDVYVLSVYNWKKVQFRAKTDDFELLASKRNTLIHSRENGWQRCVYIRQWGKRSDPRTGSCERRESFQRLCQCDYKAETSSEGPLFRVI